MTRKYNGLNSGTVYIEEDIQFHSQWVLGDKFLVYTWYRPEEYTESSSGGVGWRAEYSNKSIWKGNFIYEGDTLDLFNSTYSELAVLSIQRMQDGSIEETGFGYKFEELSYFTSGDADDLALGVSFSYSTDPTTTYNPKILPKL